MMLRLNRLGAEASGRVDRGPAQRGSGAAGGGRGRGGGGAAEREREL